MDDKTSRVMRVDCLQDLKVIALFSAVEICAEKSVVSSVLHKLEVKLKDILEDEPVHFKLLKPEGDKKALLNSSLVLRARSI